MNELEITTDLLDDTNIEDVVLVDPPTKALKNQEKVSQNQTWQQKIAPLSSWIKLGGKDCAIVKFDDNTFLQLKDLNKVTFASVTEFKIEYVGQIGKVNFKYRLKG